MDLDATQARALGCLIEKQLSTPEYYPLTLNALVNACNQSSNRDPVMQLDEATVRAALEALRDLDLAWEVHGAGARVLKFEHRLADRLSVQEAAVLAELLLRGSQTPGELRNRATRMYAFADLGEVDAALGALAEAEPPFVQQLPRAPGTKEARWVQLLAPTEAVPSAPPLPAAPGRLQQLEDEVAELKSQLAQLRDDFEALRSQLGG